MEDWTRIGRLGSTCRLDYEAGLSEVGRQAEMAW
jgi:hypothetical protein